MIMRSKRGSAAVEAAIVFPVMILSIMAVISIFVYFYDQLGKQVQMHSVLRSESGIICGNLYFNRTYDESLPVYRKSDRISCYTEAAMESAGILSSRVKQLSADKYLIDETAVVRLADFAGVGVMNDKE